MSLRQIRRAKEFAAESAGGKKTSTAVESSSSGSEEIVVRRKPAVFARLELSSSDSDSDDERSNEGAVVKEGVAEGSKPIAAAKSSASSGVKAVKNKVKAKPSSSAAEVGIVSTMDPSLKLDHRMLHASNELKRIFGHIRPAAEEGRAPRGGGTKIVVKRRHWLIEPDRNWPMVVKDVFRMELCSDGSHRLVPEKLYEASLRTFARIVVTHDIDALYQFVEMNPFHPHALVQLATVLIEQRSEFESAYQLIRRALFALQSSFLPSFHPSKSVLVSKDSVFTSTLLRALMLYAHLLAGQGCVRTSLEVYKLVYAMEGGMIAGCPMTHVLLHLDGAAYKAGQFEWLSEFVAENGLAECVPGSALLFAIAQKKRGIDVEKVEPSMLGIRVDSNTPASVALLRAIVMFPGCVKLVIGQDIPSNLRRPNQILTNKLAQAFSIKALPTVKPDDGVKTWILDIVNRVLPTVTKGVVAWANSAGDPEWLTEGYSNILSAEFEWGKSSSGSFVEPSPILESEAHILEMYCDDEGLRVPRSSNRAPMLAHAVSLESNPVAAFFGSLLPWSRVDQTGTQSDPITVRGLLESLQRSLGVGGGGNAGVADDAVIRMVDNPVDADSEESSEGPSSDEEELEME